MQQYNINLNEFAVLELLYHKGEQPIQRIGDKILITSGSITYIVDKLEKRGFVERIACPTDRRVTFTAITKAGHAFIETIFPQHEQLVAEMFSPLSDVEKDTMIDLIKKVGYHSKNL
ncbi:MarR family transcriptional regulator [Kurthia sibirica]|uniref:MarR family transcriptional regulator n=2 Tax=Kurthia sibirica TaxID=202750 RepID=A0A2U3APP3_9BACL|nr:MarR family transcriptional regulator [Kurthia sibirica]